ncbi:unnamed protein product, partial [Iphiclides podalirius]
MDKLNTLTGFELVDKGITKIQANLPELGLKDVYPTGSWLEEKQIQAAIDARKQLICAERIEKSGTISHAEWRENLMLAEVTQKNGGHWQFMGHNIGKQLYLYPEETLFLMEINCLLLKHNDVKVSLQQAYSLLFRDKVSLTQYIVYASLSRVGYKVLRHKNTTPDKDNCDQRKLQKDNVTANNSNEKSGDDQNKQAVVSEIQSKVISKSTGDENDSAMDASSEIYDNIPNSDANHATDATVNSNHCDDESRISNAYSRQILKITSRKYKPCDGKKLAKCFKSLPNVLHRQTVTVDAPEKEFVPSSISFARAAYTLNLKAVKSKGRRRALRSYSAGDEASGSHVRRVRNAPESSARNVPGYGTNQPRARFDPRQHRFPQLRPSDFWRAPFPTDYYVTFPRLLFSSMFPRLQNFYRPQYFGLSPHHSCGRFRKRLRDNAQGYHFESIKQLAARLKALTRTGSAQPENMEALNKLIQTYNNRYKSSIRLTPDHEIVESENIMETIDLDDDDEQTKSKRPRLDDTYTRNLNEIKELAKRLKELESEGKATARHRRSFSSLLRTFNKSYNADVHMSRDNEVLDRRHITLDSSSDSDCAMNEPETGYVGKKLRNPFNVLKRLSEKRAGQCFPYEPSASTSTDYSHVDLTVNDPYNEVLVKSIGDRWLPCRDDFGRPELPAPGARMLTDNLIYNYANYHPRDWASWPELKVAYLASVEESARAFAREAEECCSIVKPEDCADMATVLSKLSIVKPAGDPAEETALRVVYDVYNRDVQNFRKTSPPTPHFRVLCFDQTSTFPAGEEIAGLQSKYKDGVHIVFAIVNEGTRFHGSCKVNWLGAFLRR